MKTIIPDTRDLVLIGGGHTHALVLRKWGMRPLAGVRLTVINPGPTAPYSGMLPGFVAGHYSRDELDIDLVRLARFAGARLISGKVVAIDPVAKLISVPDRPPVGYDVASLDVGITSEMPALAGFAEHAIPAKPLGTFATRWDAFRHAAKASAPPKAAVIGGGVAGAELAMAMAYALRDTAPTVHLIDRGTVLAGFAPPARARLLASLAELGVTLVENADVAEVTADAVILSDGRHIASDFTNGAAGARPHDWIAQTGLEVQAGFVVVGRTLQSSDPDIFAVGDCAHLSHAPRPKAGVFAVRQAPVLYDNLRAHLSGGALRGYLPQKDYLKLISLGGKTALAEKLGTARRGAMLWRWKDHIDRKFMNQFNPLPVMPVAPLPLQTATGVREALDHDPLCGGCGAKVGKDALGAALARLPRTMRPDIEALPADDAAVLHTGGARQVLTTDHLSAVTNDPALMARIACIHSLGDIWAMGAAPQAAVLSLVLPRMTEPLQRRMLDEIMSTAHDVLAQAGAALVGGHTTQGESLAIGVTLTGLCEADPLTLTGAQAGDVLVLTKPIGSGTLLAGEMRGQARGQDVLACYGWMIRPQGDAARLLAEAHAMTDVTGFGLAGHLCGICGASGVGATVRLADVPLLDGALDLAAAGVRSSIFADNRGSEGVRAPDTPRAALMFDPQTCGGLLASVSPKLAQELQASGVAWIIGEVTEGEGVAFI